jgi:hypothetical protein
MTLSLQVDASVDTTRLRSAAIDGLLIRPIEAWRFLHHRHGCNEGSEPISWEIIQPSASAQGALFDVDAVVRYSFVDKIDTVVGVLVECSSAPGISFLHKSARFAIDALDRFPGVRIQPLILAINPLPKKIHSQMRITSFEPESEATLSFRPAVREICDDNPAKWIKAKSSVGAFFTPLMAASLGSRFTYDRAVTSLVRLLSPDEFSRIFSAFALISKFGGQYPEDD